MYKIFNFQSAKTGLSSRILQMREHKCEKHAMQPCNQTCSYNGSIAGLALFFNQMIFITFEGCFDT